MGDMRDEELAIGIDIGITRSRVSVWRNGEVEIIANDQGHSTTPSYVAFTDTNCLIGDAAKAQASRNPTNTIFDVTRLIGRSYSDLVAQQDLRRWPFTVKEGRGPRNHWQGPEGDIHPRGNLCRAAQAPGGHCRSVCWHSKAHQASSDCSSCSVHLQPAPGHHRSCHPGRLAGDAHCQRPQLSRPRLWPAAEPAQQWQRNILLFNLGGDSLDVLLLKSEDRISEVRATAGNAHLGGVDFDSRLASHFAAEFEHKQYISEGSPAMHRLRTVSERIKIMLSSGTQAAIYVDSLCEGLDFCSTITRACFEELCMDLFRKCIDYVQQLLTDAQLDKSAVHEVLLLGGSTHIPKVQQLLRKVFDGKELRTSPDTHALVAHGATVQAAVLTGLGGEKVQDMLLLDVAPLPLGIETAGGVMPTVIPRNTTIPTYKEQMFTTFVNDQDTVLFRVYQGDSKTTWGSNSLLGTFALSGIPPAPRGVPQICFNVGFDATGTVEATAKDPTTGASATITCTRATACCSKSGWGPVVLVEAQGK